MPSPMKEFAQKPTAARKSLVLAAAKKEKAALKTPGRARSLAPARKAPEPEPEEPKIEPKTQRRGKSLIASEVDKEDDPLSLPLSTKGG